MNGVVANPSWWTLACLILSAVVGWIVRLEVKLSNLTTQQKRDREDLSAMVSEVRKASDSIISIGGDVKHIKDTVDGLHRRRVNGNG